MTNPGTDSSICTGEVLSFANWVILFSHYHGVTARLGIGLWQSVFFIRIQTCSDYSAHSRTFPSHSQANSAIFC